MLNQEDKLLSIKEVSKQLRLSTSTIYSYIEVGYLKAFKVKYNNNPKTFIVIKESDLKQFIEENTL
ncbi:MAG: helix-turn-helix domain-containing protein [Candidatus Dojkabacteria bacterium]|nr:helix-turn-helix domain-containing protein [Candidatus Dojkabacteria bacterium]